MKTNQNYTFEILGGYLMDNNEVNAEYLAEQVIDYAERIADRYNECFNTRRKPRNVAIEWLMDFINRQLKNSGYVGFYASNAQVMAFDRKHGGSLERVLDIIEEEVKTERESCL